MYIALGIVIILVAILLILVVIIQNPKGGMMSSSIGRMGNQLLGAGRSTDAVEKVTLYLAVGLMVLSVASIFFLPDAKEVENSDNSENSVVKEALDKNKSASPALPTAPIAPPAQQQTAPAAQPSATPPQGK